MIGITLLDQRTESNSDKCQRNRYVSQKSAAYRITTLWLLLCLIQTEAPLGPTSRGHGPLKRETCTNFSSSMQCFFLPILRALRKFQPGTLDFAVTLLVTTWKREQVRWRFHASVGHRTQSSKKHFSHHTSSTKLPLHVRTTGSTGKTSLSLVHTW